MIGEIIGPKEFNVERGYERTFHMLVSSHNWDDCIPFITFGKDWGFLCCFKDDFTKF